MSIFAAGTKTRNTMATTTVTREGKVRNIFLMLDKIPTRYLGDIERKIQLYLAALEAKRMDATVKKNNITMADIVAEVKKARNGD